MPGVVVRPFGRADVAALLDLMKDLARFEGYLDDFAVTKADLITHGLGRYPRFRALVADHGGTIVGMAVTYEIPWAFDLRPRLVLKELFVTKAARGLGVGKALIAGVKGHALEIGASQISWTVLKDNSRAERFYADLGGQPDPVWNNWVMDC